RYHLKVAWRFQVAGKRMWIYIWSVRGCSIRADLRVVARCVGEVLRRIPYLLGGCTAVTEVKIVSAFFEAIVFTAAGIQSKLPVHVIVIVPSETWLERRAGM